MKVTQSCPTLCKPMDCSLPGSSVHGIFQARVLEWGAIAFSELSLVLSNKVLSQDQNVVLYNPVLSRVHLYSRYKIIIPND